MVSVIPNKVDNRYIIRDEVGRGGMGIVYSAYDRLTGDIVALKNVQPDFEPTIEATTSSIADFRVALAQEFSVLATLRHPNIISVLDFGFDFEKQPYFTMTLLNDPKTVVEYSATLSVIDKVELIIQMLEAIDYLHRRGIVHRDLKPDNVIIEDGQLKVLDFGVAWLQNQSRNEPSDMLVGTLAFMAPELFGDGPRDELAKLSDIYAAGLICYEILAGEFPYDTSNVSTLVMEIAGKLPDSEPIENLSADLDTYHLAAIISRMVAKDPYDRYLGTDAVLQAFHDLLDRVRTTNVEVRESILQTAAMVGRRAELKELDKSLKLAFAEQGSVWLLGGETGVGKSRLVDELRIRALVRGALVVRGQTVSEASAPFQLWRDVLTRLLLEIDVTPLEASVLKPYVDNIARLLDVDDVPDAPKIGAVESYNRLLTVVQDMLIKVNRPLLIILEDLHWASESLYLLRQIIPQTQINPIMIVGTYRSDENPKLPDSLSGSHIMQIEPLAQSAISAYAESVVGLKTGLTQVVELLQSETNGNVMFMIEILRAIIEDLGMIENFDRNKVSSEMLGGGMPKVIRYRLKKMATDDYDMLKMAAVLGRVININVMNKIFGEERVKVWLQSGEEMMFLRIRNDQWRISNNSIRQTVLDDIEDSEAVNLHKKAANAIYEIDGEIRGAAKLAYHWASAKDVAQEAKYTAIAVEESFESSAFPEAAEYLTRLLSLHEQDQIPQEKLTLARYRRMLGTCYLELGDLTKARNSLREAVSELRAPIPNKTGAQIVMLLGEIIRQVWHRMVPMDRITKSAQIHDEIFEAGHAMNLLAEVTLAYAPEPILSVYCGIRGINMGELIGPGFPLAFSYSGTSILAAAIGRRSWAQTYINLAEGVLEQGMSDSTIAIASFNMAVVHAGWGEWQATRDLVERCMTAGDKVGDWKSWRQAAGLAGDVHHFLGEYDSAIQRYVECFELTKRVRNLSQMGIQLSIRARTLFYAGRFQEAMEAADEAIRLDESPMTNLNAHPVHVLNALRLHEWDNVEAQVAKLSEKISKNVVKFYVQLDGYSAAAEAYIALLGQKRSEELEKATEKACKDLTAFAKTFPIGEARAKIFEARRLYLMSAPDKAEALAQEGLDIATSFRMPYDQGLGLMVLGRIRNDDQLIAQAQEIFQRIRHQWGLHQLENMDI